jgi:hypothetical protein
VNASLMKAPLLLKRRNYDYGRILVQNSDLLEKISPIIVTKDQVKSDRIISGDLAFLSGLAQMTSYIHAVAHSG